MAAFDIQRINVYFKNNYGEDFPDFFNNNIRGRGFFPNNKIVKEAFNNFFRPEVIEVAYGSRLISIWEFLVLTTIIYNETGGRFRPLSEFIGNAGNKGISYAFNKIAGTKKSYNTLPQNKTAFELFNDSNYIDQHQGKKFGNLLANTKDQRWNGTRFPYGFSNGSSSLETSKSTSFLTEADFYKFRGRGYIQTTGRGNYSSLITYILGYNGDDRIINAYKNLWSSPPYNSQVDNIASRSVNGDWDVLFDRSNQLCARAIRIHSNAAGNYLDLDTNGLTPSQLSSYIYNIGLRISGSKNYAKKYQNRLYQIKLALGLE